MIAEMMLPGGMALAAWLALKPLFRAGAVAKPDGVEFGGEFFTWDELAKHVLFLGGTGSGKTYASNKLIKALMRAGVFMCFNTCKPDDFERIRELARETGQWERLDRIDPEGDKRMNFIESALKPHKSVTQAAQNTMKLAQIGKAASSSSGDNRFFEVMAERGIGHAITMCLKHAGTPRLGDMRELIATTPTNAAARKEEQWSDKSPDETTRRSLCAKWIIDGCRKGWDVSDRAYRNASSYFLYELPDGGDKMRGSVNAEIENCLGKLAEPPWDYALSSETTYRIEDAVANRRLMVIDAPEMTWEIPGRMYTFAWMMELQRLGSRRKYRKHRKEEMVFVREEAGRTIVPSFDANMMLVARSQGMIMVDLVQDKESLLLGLGGGKADNEGWAILDGHLCATYLFRMRSVDTAEWASKLIGMHKVVKPQGCHGGGSNANLGDELLGVNSGFSWGIETEPVVRAEEMRKLPVGVAVTLLGDRWKVTDFRE